MSGIYIHIPFCKQACHYCNFHFATSLHYKKELVEAIARESRLRKDFLQGELVETIYLGGGTPSLLDKDELGLLLDSIRTHFPVNAKAEISLEANPDDITDKKLQDWSRAGINRLSIGVQSFFDEDLLWMNRAHQAEQALTCLKLAGGYFDNISIDLIYGSPGLTNEKWKYNVDTATRLGIPHLSCYALTVEPRTPLDKLIRLQKTADIDPDEQSNQFLLLMEWTATAGYEHYEISNFAKPGWRSRHNSAYWQGKPYLGLGPSAHSYNRMERLWNPPNNQQYILALQKEDLPLEKEILSPLQQLNEYIMISLRTLEGISLEILRRDHGLKPDQFLQKANGFIQSGHLIESDGHLALTREGRLLADGIAAGLFE